MKLQQLPLPDPAMSLAVLTQLAAYNRWANARIYEAALAMPDEAYRRPIGVFFGTLHGTLNHILAADRIWLKRITGRGDAPDRLDAILFEDPIALARARVAEDARIAATVAALDETALATTLTYTTTAGVTNVQPLGEVLLHVFNHQTHHRGQAHACCSILTGTAPPLDLLAFQRGLPAPDLAALAAPGGGRPA